MQPIQLLKQPLLLLSFLLLPPLCFSQVTQAWVRRYNGTGNGNDYAHSLVVDANGNVYVTGDTGTIKYDAAGNELWVRSSRGTDMAVDANGNVYVTGPSTDYIVEPETGTQFHDYVTIKYDTNGNELWVKRYNSGLYTDNVPYAIAVDASGNVYVTGEGNIRDGFGIGLYTTIKYDATGKELWIKQRGSIGIDGVGDAGRATSLAVDAGGNVYVTGDVCLNCDFDYVSSATIKYDAAGNQLWLKGYSASEGGSGGGGAFVLYLVAVDSTGNAYVTGGDRTVKYDADGNEVWVKGIIGTDMAVDDLGNLYLTGFMPFNNDSVSGFTPITAKYDAAGKELWVKSKGGDHMAVDDSGNVYVTGGGNDYATIKLDANGNDLWIKRYNGPGNSTDAATSLAVDASGNVYVTGRSWGNGTGYDYATIKYVPPQQSTNRWYRDADGDGWGSPSNSKEAKEQPRGYVSNNLDCNDKNKVKGGPEVCDGIDNDCNGIIDDGLTETTFYSDFDGDGYGSDKRTITTCAPPSKFITVGGDCNDDNAIVYPGAPELCDGRDNDCNGVIDDGLTLKPFYWDADKDGYGFFRPVYACSAPPGYITVGGDCKDNNADIHPGAVEHCDGIDEDCDGVIDDGFVQKRFYKDRDFDGWGSNSNLMAGCAPPGYVEKWGDCNDYDGTVNPDVSEVPDNGKDDNCNGEVDEQVVTRNRKSDREVKEASLSSLQLTVTPNPATNYFTLHISSNMIKAVQLQVVDGVGRVVDVKRRIPSKSTLAVGHSYRPGVYYVEVFQEGRKATLKLVKTTK